MLAVSEDATAAQLMGIRPERMQAMAWAMAAGATGIAGALIATFFYTSPTVGETLAIIAFVTVSFGGFGSVPGALVAGLIIGVIESLSAYLIGPVYKDVIVYFAVRAGAVVPAAGPDGQGMKRAICSRVRWLALALAYPLLVAAAGLAAAGRAGAAGAPSAPRPGTSSAAMPARSRSAMRCSSASAPTPRSWSTPISAAADRRRADRHGAERR